MSETLFIRTQKVERFTRISNAVLQDKNLSMQAIGLFCYILSLPDDWKIRLTEVQKHFKNGRESFRSTVKELEENGYLEREETERVGGKFCGYNFKVIEEPNRRLETVDGEPMTETKQIQTTNNKLLNNKSIEPKFEDVFPKIKKSFKNQDYKDCQSLIDSCRNTLKAKGKNIDTSVYPITLYKKLLHKWFSTYGVEETKKGIMNSISFSWLVNKGYKLTTLFSDSIFPQCVSASWEINNSPVQIQKGKPAFEDKERDFSNDEGEF